MGIYEELEWRGLIKDVSSPELREKLNAGGRFISGRIRPGIVCISGISRRFSSASA